MIVRSLFLVLLASGIAACATEELFYIDPDPNVAPISRPVVTQVILEENPVTIPAYAPKAYTLHPSVETDPCVGLALTEDEVKEYFRVATPIWSGNYKDCMPTPCRIRGKIVLKDGKKGVFEIDLGRQGWWETPDRLGVHYYCEDCKNKKFFEPDPLPVERACSNITPDEWERLDNESQTP